MTAVPRFDLAAQERSVVVSADGLLAEFNDTGVLGPLDVLAASTIARLCGESDESVILAAAMTVRGTRFGHVCISLDTLRDAIAVDGQDPEIIEALRVPRTDRCFSRGRCAARVGWERGCVERGEAGDAGAVRSGFRGFRLLVGIR